MSVDIGKYGQDYCTGKIAPLVNILTGRIKSNDFAVCQGEIYMSKSICFDRYSSGICEQGRGYAGPAKPAPVTLGLDVIKQVRAHFSRSMALSCQRPKMRRDIKLVTRNISTPVTEISNNAANMRGVWS